MSDIVGNDLSHRQPRTPFLPGTGRGTTKWWRGIAASEPLVERALHRSSSDPLPGTGVVGEFFVILNLFQDPCATSGQRSGALGSGDRAWMLKQVQHDDRGDVVELRNAPRAEEERTRLLDTPCNFPLIPADDRRERFRKPLPTKAYFPQTSHRTAIEIICAGNREFQGASGSFQGAPSLCPAPK